MWRHRQGRGSRQKGHRQASPDAASRMVQRIGTTVVGIISRPDTQRKLEIPARRDARYDLACACSTSRDEGRRRGSDGRWIYPVALPNGGNPGAPGCGAARSGPKRPSGRFWTTTTARRSSACSSVPASSARRRPPWTPGAPGFDERGQLSLEIDPKEAWARCHPEAFPVDVNRASRLELLRVPGLGPVTVNRIVQRRRIPARRDSRTSAKSAPAWPRRNRI